MELLREEARRGAAVIVTLHDLSLASRFCDRLVVLKQGRVIAQGPPDDALSDDTLADAFGITAQRVANDGARTVVPWQRL
jgi:iron complex transport system ATP-binding protein